MQLSDSEVTNDIVVFKKVFYVGIDILNLF